MTRKFLCMIGIHNWRLLDVMNGPICFECRRCKAYKEQWPWP